MKDPKQPSRSKASGAKLIHACLTILKENGGEMPMRDLMDAIGKRVTLTEWELERYAKTNYLRWQSMLHFYSVDCTKAGFLVKKKGVWYLTPEGEQAAKLDPIAAIDKASRAYRQWKAAQPVEAAGEAGEEEVGQLEPGRTLEQVEQLAQEELEAHIGRMNAYDFQDLVAAMLRGMAYYTPFVAPKGKDGGVDVMAYRDPLGTQSPRIQVQVKHRDTPATAAEIRELMGLLQKEGAVGIFVSSHGFTADARVTARGSHVHVELIDLQRLLTLWQEFYPKLTDADKALMPLTPVYFLARPD